MTAAPNQSARQPDSSRAERRTRRTREAILSAALDILAREGGGALSAERVAALADVAVQTVYNRVGGRDALMVAVTERALEENHAYMDAALAASGSGEERITAAAEAYIRFAFERPAAFRTMAHPPELAPDEHRYGALLRLAALIETQNAKVADQLRVAQDEAVVDRELDAGTTATTLWAIWNGVLGFALDHDRFGASPADVAAVIDCAKMLLLRGLRVGEGQKP